MVISVTGFTAARSQAIEDEAIVSGTVNVSGDLILSKFGGGTVNAGNVQGPTGPSGSGLIICTSSTRPGSPAEGDMIWENDTNRIYIWPGGSWRWVWSQNGEDKVRLKFEVPVGDDATAAATWPAGLEVAVAVPIWAKDIEGFALIGQAFQVTDDANTEISLLLGAGVIARKRIRWNPANVPASAKQDLTLMGTYDCSAMAGSSQLFRVKGERVSGVGATRLDSESVCYITGRFTDT